MYICFFLKKLMIRSIAAAFWIIQLSTMTRGKFWHGTGFGKRKGRSGDFCLVARIQEPRNGELDHGLEHSSQIA